MLINVYLCLFMFNILFKLITLIRIKVTGDWGLGIGDWAQSPIPNPQSPFLLNFLIKY